MINYLIHIFKFKSKTLKIYIKNNIKYYYITLIIEQKLSQFDLKKKSCYFVGNGCEIYETLFLVCGRNARMAFIE